MKFGSLFALYLVRHAHSAWSVDEKRGLSPTGLCDAQRISDILGHYPIEAIYSSPSRRTIQTINPLAKALHLHVQTDLRLAERKLGPDPVEDFQRTIQQLWQEPTTALPGGESNQVASARAIAFIEFLLTQKQAALKQQIVLSTHGNLMALILQHYYPEIDYTFWSRMTFPDIYLLPLMVNENVCLNLQTDYSHSHHRLWHP